MPTEDELYTAAIDNVERAVNALTAATETVTGILQVTSDGLPADGNTGATVSGQKTFNASPVVATQQEGDNSTAAANAAFVRANTGYADGVAALQYANEANTSCAQLEEQFASLQVSGDAAIVKAQVLKAKAENAIAGGGSEGGTSVVVSAPSIVGDASCIRGMQASYRLSASCALSNGYITKFVYTVGSIASGELTATGNACNIQFTVPGTMSAGDVIEITAYAMDNLHSSSLLTHLFPSTSKIIFCSEEHSSTQSSPLLLLIAHIP